MEDYWKNFSPGTKPFSEKERDEMLSVILDLKNRSTIRPIKIFKSWKHIAAVVAIVLMASMGLVYYNLYSGQKHTHQTFDSNEIIPGKTGATLTLADGKKIKLDDVNNGEIAHEAGIIITKSADGQLVYEIKENSAETNQFNTLSTAKGETYQVRLPDGSLVWLNAASSLTYSSNLISGGRRIVKLEGEGYFEIAKDKTYPFVVESKGQQIEILGTHFNVNAYADEGQVTTTLLEGSVKINGDIYLKPGQQSICKGNQIKVIPANGEVETAWKNGRFSFTGKDFKSLMRTIARWYNVDIVYDYHPINLRIGGEISRFENIEDVLELIQETGDVKFKIDGRKLIVME